MKKSKTHKCNNVISEIPRQVGSDEAGETAEGDTGVVHVCAAEILTHHVRRQHQYVRLIVEAL